MAGRPVIGGQLPDICEGMDEAERRRRLEVLFRQHADAVHAYALRRSDRATADDTVGEVFAIACRRLHEVPDASLPWLLACARRVLANQRRSVRRVSTLRSRLATSAALRVSTEEDDGLLRLALNQLSERDREVLLLTAWEGLGPAETATVMGCSRGAALTRLHRARKRLQATLDRLECPNAPNDSAEVVR